MQWVVGHYLTGLAGHRYVDGLLLPTRVAWSVGLSVGLSVTVVSPTKTAEPIEMLFELRTRVGLKNHMLHGGPDPFIGRSNFEGRKGCPL